MSQHVLPAPQGLPSAQQVPPTGLQPLNVPASSVQHPLSQQTSKFAETLLGQQDWPALHGVPLPGQQKPPDGAHPLATPRESKQHVLLIGQHRLKTELLQHCSPATQSRLPGGQTPPSTGGQELPAGAQLPSAQRVSSKQHSMETQLPSAHSRSPGTQPLPSPSQAQVAGLRVWPAGQASRHCSPQQVCSLPQQSPLQQAPETQTSPQPLQLFGSVW